MPATRYKFELRTARRRICCPSRPTPTRFRPNCARRRRASSRRCRRSSRRSATRQRANALDAPLSIYEVHLGSWRRKPEEGDRLLNWDELADTLLPYAQRHGLHAPRAAAGQRTSVRRLLGLPAHRHVRGDGALRRPARPAPLRRPRARAGSGRAARLGAGAFPDRRARPGAVRRHGALRVRRPARGLPQRLGHADLQLRPHRGAQLPRRQRALLARALRRRRPARRRRRVDAVPRLQPRARRMDPERPRRAREPGSDRASSSA